MNKNLKTDLEQLKTQDIYSFILFALYKMKDIPEYSSLSQLSYILDKDNLLKLCEYFGGTTIRIPTIQELEVVVFALLLYQQVNIEGDSLEVSYSKLNTKTCSKYEVKKVYFKLLSILKDYNFTGK